MRARGETENLLEARGGPVHFSPRPGSALPAVFGANPVPLSLALPVTTERLTVDGEKARQLARLFYSISYRKGAAVMGVYAQIGGFRQCAECIGCATKRTPKAAQTRLIVSKRGSLPGRSALYKASRAIPASFAT